LILTLTCGTFQAKLATSGNAEATGRCNAVVTGSHDQVTINCGGVSGKQGQELSILLNKVLAKRLNPALVASKLDEIKANQKLLTERLASLERSLAEKNKNFDKTENSRSLKAETQYLFQDVYEFARQWDAQRPILPREPQIKPMQYYFENWNFQYNHWRMDRGQDFRILFGKRISFLIDKLEKGKIDSRSLYPCKVEQPSTDDFNACGTALLNLSLKMSD
jgi:hypothetical protein